MHINPIPFCRSLRPVPPGPDKQPRAAPRPRRLRARFPPRRSPILGTWTACRSTRASPEIVALLRASRAVVIEAPPGAGKTTRVPRALLDAGFAQSGEILVIQPRRLPARLAAARIADELGETPGGTIGYTVRFEDVAGPRTRVRVMTEGILTRRLLTDPDLGGVSVVVLDEFHERHLATDVALAFLRRLQRGRRPDLKLCVMSATLDAEPVSAYLDACPRVRSEGRRFDVRIEHLPKTDEGPLSTQVRAAVRRIIHEEPTGDVLVFLPGAAEIRRCEEALAPVAEQSRLLVVSLHGDLPLAAQARAVAPADRRKVILSTNVAETSVTIDGVVAVVDSGSGPRRRTFTLDRAAHTVAGEDQPSIRASAGRPRGTDAPGNRDSSLHTSRLRGATGVRHPRNRSPRSGGGGVDLARTRHFRPGRIRLADAATDRRAGRRRGSARSAWCH